MGYPIKTTTVALGMNLCLEEKRVEAQQRELKTLKSEYRGILSKRISYGDLFPKPRLRVLFMRNTYVRMQSP